MRRLGAFKAAEKAEALAEHLALPVNERLNRGVMLSKRERVDRRVLRDPEDLAAFFERARRLGLYRP